MTRETIQRAATWRTDQLYSAFPRTILFRGHTFTGRMDPVTAQVDVVDGGAEVEITAEVFLRIADLSLAGLTPPKKWELITVDGQTFAIVSRTETPTFGEYSLRLANPQAVAAFS